MADPRDQETHMAGQDALWRLAELAKALVVERDALIIERGLLREVLRDVEWNGYSFVGLMPCPSCGGEEPCHRDGCSLAAALHGSQRGAV